MRKLDVALVVALAIFCLCIISIHDTVSRQGEKQARLIVDTQNALTQAGADIKELRKQITILQADFINIKQQCTLLEKHIATK